MTAPTDGVAVLSLSPGALAQFAKAAREEAGLTLMQVSERSGGQITDGHVSRIENGFVKNVKPDKLRALARGLGVPLLALAMAALGLELSEADAEELQLLTYYRSCPGNYQKDLIRIARMFHAEHGTKPARELKIDKYVEKKRRAA